jgi:branched-chain amino acid transport system ATP-binding protein
VLSVDNLSVFYGDAQALWDVSFRIEPGHIVILVGANGAGKTTTLKAISGLLRPRRGSIQFEGQELTELGPHHIVERGVAHVPEGRKLWARMTVRENLELGAYPARARRLKETIRERVLALFPRLEVREKQIAGTLSGGEQQMVAIGRALMSSPRLLLLDEPSLGLAPRLVGELFEVIREINAQGVTVLLVEQNLGQALSIAHRGLVLETGRVVLEATGEELLKTPSIRSAYLGR